MKNNPFRELTVWELTGMGIEPQAVGCLPCKDDIEGIDLIDFRSTPTKENTGDVLNKEYGVYYQSNSLGNNEERPVMGEGENHLEKCDVYFK